jgi:hypothetical protein
VSIATQGLSLDALIDALADAVATRVLERMAGTATASPKRLMDLKEAGEYIGRSPRAVRALIQAGAFPSVEHDRRVFVDRRDVDGWIERSKKE